LGSGNPNTGLEPWLPVLKPVTKREKDLQNKTLSYLSTIFSLMPS